MKGQGQEPYKRMDHWVSDVSSVSPGRDHTSKFKRQSAGRLGSPADPAESFSTGWVMGQCYSETQLSLQSCVSICSYSVRLFLFLSVILFSFHEGELLLHHMSSFLFLTGQFQFLKL